MKVPGCFIAAGVSFSRRPSSTRWSITFCRRIASGRVPGAERGLEAGLDPQQLRLGDHRRVHLAPERRVVVERLVRPAGVLHVEGELVLCGRVDGHVGQVEVVDR